MNKSKQFFLVLPLLVLCGIFSGCMMTEPDVETEVPKQTDTIAVPANTSTAVEKILPTIQAPDGWLIYANEEIGFSFAYPESYSVLTDEDSLYGWENGMVLIYNGGQSYDIVVQIWDSLDEPEVLYGNRMGDITVFESGGRYITVFDITMEAENAEIISTFLAAD